MGYTRGLLFENLRPPRVYYDSTQSLLWVYVGFAFMVHFTHLSVMQTSLLFDNLTDGQTRPCIFQIHMYRLLSRVYTLGWGLLSVSTVYMLHVTMGSFEVQSRAALADPLKTLLRTNLTESKPPFNIEFTSGVCNMNSIVLHFRNWEKFLISLRVKIFVMFCYSM